MTNTILTDSKQLVKRFLAQLRSPILALQQEHKWKECRQQENETINEFVVRLHSLWLEKKLFWVSQAHQDRFRPCLSDSSVILRIYIITYKFECEVLLK